MRVYEGNTADPKTVKDQVAKLREQFALDLVVLVGDRRYPAATRGFLETRL